MVQRVRKCEVIDKAYREVIFGIVRTDSEESAFLAAEALIAAGIEMQEISMTTPGALKVIRRLSDSHSEAIIGAGTVLDATTARLVIEAGGDFIVCPNLNPEVVVMASRYGIPVMPGVATVSELLSAMALGVDVVKAFPGSVLGPEFIRALKGPVPQARAIPVGGVSRENLREWLDAGAFALGLGKGLTHPDGSCDDPGRIRANAEAILTEIDDERRRRRDG